MKTIILVFLLTVLTNAQSEVLLLMSDGVAPLTYILNDDFSTSACGVEWTCASSWSIADGKATTDDINANQLQNASAILTAGVTYILEIDVVTPENPFPSTIVYFTFGFFDIGITVNLLGSYQTQYGGIAGDSTYSFEFTPVAGTNGITIHSHTGGTTDPWSIDAIRIYIKPD